MVVGRVASVLVIPLVLVLYRSEVAMPGRLAAVAGAVGTVAIILYLAATRHQLTAVAAVLSELSPVIPVLLAQVFLRGRRHGAHRPALNTAVRLRRSGGPVSGACD